MLTGKDSLSRSNPRHFALKVESYQVIRKASSEVYEALWKACTKHAEHLAHFCIEAEHEVADRFAVPQVKFNLAFTHLTLANYAMAAEPIWFMIDSIIEEGIADNTPESKNELNKLADTLKRQLQEPVEHQKKRVKKSVRFATPALVPVPTIAMVNSSRSPEVAKTILSKQGNRRDFCDYLRQYCRQNTQENTCLGLLDRTESWKHLVYPPSHKCCTKYSQAVSLEQLLSTMTQDGAGPLLLQHECLRLVKSLAIAVLQYNSTPWLKRAWRSRDVSFFGLDSRLITEGITDLPTPHLSAKVKEPHESLPQAPALLTHKLYSNPVLFSLGVLMIEIAFSSPMKNLQLDCDLENGRETQYTEFFTAKRLARGSITRRMGVPYGKIAKKLIEGQFGCGDDLQDPRLQTEFHRDVVCELDQLEQDFKAWHFGE